MASSIQSTEINDIRIEENTADSSLYSNQIEASTLELLTLLQSTLELRPMLKHFLEKLRKHLSVDGIFFFEEERQIRVRIGRQAIHSCGYNLNNGEFSCGELVFKRSTRFSEPELQKIEELLILLLVPITNALKYKDAVKSALNKPSQQITERRSLTSTLKREIELAKRHNNQLSLGQLFIEFEPRKVKKKDREEAISLLSERLKTELLSTDLLLRSGNTEYFLLTHRNSQLTEELKNHIEDLKSNLVLCRDEEVECKINCGFATLTGTDTVSSLIARTKHDLELIEN